MIKEAKVIDFYVVVAGVEKRTVEPIDIEGLWDWMECGFSRDNYSKMSKKVLAHGSKNPKKYNAVFTVVHNVSGDDDVSVEFEEIAEAKEFTYENGYVTYETKESSPDYGNHYSIYIDESDSYDLGDIEDEFDEMLDQCGDEFDAKNRKELFKFIGTCRLGYVPDENEEANNKKMFESAVADSLEKIFFEFNGQKGCHFGKEDLKNAVFGFMNSGFFEN